MMEEINFPQITLRDYQKNFWNAMALDEDNLRSVLVWPRRCGKDIVCINLLAAKAMQRRADYAYIAPYATQVRNIIWNGQSGEGKKFIDYIPSELIARKLDQTMKIFLKNGSTITLYGSDNPDALVGTAFAGVVFTEFSLHKDVIWHFIRPMLLENKGWAVFNGTPRGMNAFYTMAKMAKKNPSWFYERLTCEETGFPTLEQIQEERDAGMPESLIEQEYFTSWTSSTEETLIPLEHIQRCMNTTLASVEYEFAPRIIGVDPAYAEKGDRAVICRRQGRFVHPFDVYQGIDPMALAAKVAHYLREWRANYAFIDAGRGEAVWSRLFQLGFEDRVIPVDFGGTTYDPLFHRKKDEMWGRAKAAVCNKTLPMEFPESEEFARDLGAPTFEIDDRGIMKLETKKSLKKRGFASTDLGDAFILTYAEELDETPFLTDKMKELGVTEDLLMQLHHQDNGIREEDYDPLTYMESLVEGKAYAQ